MFKTLNVSIRAVMKLNKKNVLVINYRDMLSLGEHVLSS